MDLTPRRSLLRKWSLVAGAFACVGCSVTRDIALPSDPARVDSVLHSEPTVTGYRLVDGTEHIAAGRLKFLAPDSVMIWRSRTRDFDGVRAGETTRVAKSDLSSISVAKSDSTRTAFLIAGSALVLGALFFTVFALSWHGFPGNHVAR